VTDKDATETGGGQQIGGPEGGGPPATHGFGIVGTGVIAEVHADAIAAIPGATLVAVADVLPEQAAAFAAARGCAAEPDLAALLARDDIDVVSVCVPSGRHADVGVQIAAAGKHLVVEKPLDVTLAAADRLIDAVRAAGVAMTVISQHRFDPGLIELRRLVDAGALGRLVLGEAATKWYRSQGYYDSADWRGTWALDGGALMNQGIHYADLLRWIMGPVTEVTAVSATEEHQIEAEDVSLALLRFASGAVGTIVSSTAVFPGFAQRLEISGTNGTVVIEDGQVSYEGLRAGVTDPGLRGYRAATGASLADAGPNAADLGISSHIAQIADLLAAVDEKRDPLVTAADGRQTLELIIAVYESARAGRTVVLPAGNSGGAADEGTTDGSAADGSAGR
jgi:UDP-N-acetyl-2-amino-2-deoxyglucuronate dehydrogenase